MITSINNQTIKNISLLLKKGKARKEQDAFVAEGMRMFTEIPKAQIIKVFVSEGFLQSRTEHDFLEGIDYEVVCDKVFKEISDTKTPQGILAIVKQFHYTIQEILEKKPTHLLLLEDIQDPGNLGSILRAGEGAGVTGVVMSKGTVDIYNPKVVRATMGSIYRVPFLYAEELEKVIEQIQSNGKVYAAHLEGSAVYDEIDYTGNIGILIGNEGNGLKKETAQLADACIRIPMEGKVESLNAGVASAVLMYEVYRQRRKK